MSRLIPVFSGGLVLKPIQRALCIALGLYVCAPTSAWATWSIIVLDRRSGLIGVAAASCTSDVYGIMAVVPGSGALMAQAIGHPPGMREALRLLREGQSPDSVLRVIVAPSVDTGAQHRQYALATMAKGQIQFTGDSVASYRGERAGDGILVQGNTLASAAVLDHTLAAIETARAAGRPLEEVVMAGLRAGADAGGDRRCGGQRATSAFLAVVRPGDVPNWPYLTLRVVGVEPGTAVNAVDVLRARLALWQQNGGAQNRLTSETVRP